jgi:hypothetical protein
MKKKTLLAALLAAALTLGASVGSALAYFSAYTSAGGERALALVPVTTITETQVNENMKKIVVTNTGGAPCFVRVLAFPGGGVTLGGEGGNGWAARNTEGYWYYAPVLAPGEASGELEIPIGDLPAEGEFNIALVYESTPAIYNAGTGDYEADWSLDVTIVDDGSGGGAG